MKDLEGEILSFFEGADLRLEEYSNELTHCAVKEAQLKSNSGIWTEEELQEIETEILSLREEIRKLTLLYGMYLGEKNAYKRVLQLVKNQGGK